MKSALVRVNFYTLLALSSVFYCFNGQAKTLNVIPSVSADNVIVDHESQINEDTDNAQINTNTLTLGLRTHYQTKKISWTSTLNTEYIFRNALSGDNSENFDAFLTFNSLARFALWQDKLTVVTELNRSQQAETQGISVGNKLFRSDNWFEVNRGMLSLNFQTKLTPKAIFSSQLQTSKTQADIANPTLFTNAERINTDSTSLTSQLSSTEQSQLLTWSARSRFSDTSRATQGDIQSTNINVNNEVKLFPSFAVTGLASYSNQKVKGNIQLSNQLEYKQVGIGAKWISDKGSYITIDLINADSKRTPNEVYVGGSMFVQLSEFSSFTLEKKKNALGQSDAFTLKMRGKYYELSSGYANTIDISTRFGTSSGDSELFTCPVNANDISQCFLSTGVAQIDQSQYFQTSFTQAVVELNEQISNKESLNIKVALDNNKKLKASTTLTYSQQTFLEGSQRTLESQSIASVISYKLNSTSHLAINYKQNDIKQSGVTQPRKQKQLDITFNKNLGRNTEWSTFLKDINSQQNTGEIKELQIGTSIKMTMK